MVQRIKIPEPGMVILSTAYFAPIEYYAYLINAAEIYIEHHETYPKQTYRNRCVISGPNRLLALTVPVHRKGNIPVKEVKIAYREDWQTLHWRTLEACYNSSPYFKFYDYELLPFFKKKFDFLLDLNEAVQGKILETLGVKPEIKPAPFFKKDYDDAIDLRNSIIPKTRNNNMPRYPQVFDSKYGFQPNLSILDLLFNKGPDAAAYLEELNFDPQ